MSSANFQPGSLFVGRAADLAAVVQGPLADWLQMPGSRVVLLPDAATAEDVRIVVASIMATSQAATPTGAPPPG